jgi:hypothetical protein
MIIEYVYIYYILVGGRVGAGGVGGFLGGLCANQLIICSFYSHKKTWNNQAYLYFIFVPIPVPFLSTLLSGI